MHQATPNLRINCRPYFRVICGILNRSINFTREIQSKTPLNAFIVGDCGNEFLLGLGVKLERH